MSHSQMCRELGYPVVTRYEESGNWVRTVGLRKVNFCSLPSTATSDLQSSRKHLSLPFAPFYIYILTPGQSRLYTSSTWPLPKSPCASLLLAYYSHYCMNPLGSAHRSYTCNVGGLSRLAPAFRALHIPVSHTLVMRDVAFAAASCGGFEARGCRHDACRSIDDVCRIRRACNQDPLRRSRLDNGGCLTVLISVVPPLAIQVVLTVTAAVTVTTLAIAATTGAEGSFVRD
jgi:hypothetical protein